MHAGVAKLVAQVTCTHWVAGSSPVTSSNGLTYPFSFLPRHALLSIDGDAYGEDGSNPSVVRVCSETKPLYLGVAQMVVRLLWEQDVGGSSPLTQTNFIEEGCHVSVSRYSGRFRCTNPEQV